MSVRLSLFFSLYPHLIFRGHKRSTYSLSLLFVCLPSFIFYAVSYQKVFIDVFFPEFLVSITILILQLQDNCTLRSLLSILSVQGSSIIMSWYKFFYFMSVQHAPFVLSGYFTALPISSLLFELWPSICLNQFAMIPTKIKTNCNFTTGPLITWLCAL
jgi:hypothetical protein